MHLLTRSSFQRSYEVTHEPDAAPECLCFSHMCAQKQHRGSLPNLDDSISWQKKSLHSMHKNGGFFCVIPLLKFLLQILHARVLFAFPLFLILTCLWTAVISHDNRGAPRGASVTVTAEACDQPSSNVVFPILVRTGVSQPPQKRKKKSDRPYRPKKVLTMKHQIPSAMPMVYIDLE